MKKPYESPSAEKIAFQYRGQIVVASGHNGTCSFDYKDDSANSTSVCITEWTGPQQ